MRTQELRPCLPSPPCSASSVPSSVTPDHGSRHWVLVQSPRSSWAGRFSLSFSKRGNLKLDKVSRLQTVFPRILIHWEFSGALWALVRVLGRARLNQSIEPILLFQVQFWLTKIFSIWHDGKKKLKNYRQDRSSLRFFSTLKSFNSTGDSYITITSLLPR